MNMSDTDSKFNPKILKEFILRYFNQFIFLKSES